MGPHVICACMALLLLGGIDVAYNTWLQSRTNFTSALRMLFMRVKAICTHCV